MCKLFSIIALSLICFGTKAQAPSAIPYQAVVRNAAGAMLANQTVKIRFSIRDSITAGVVLYRELHTVNTNAQGLISLNIGTGSVLSGTFSGINWGRNAKYMQAELDGQNNNIYTDLGTTQMMSVPYALNAGNGLSAGTNNGEMLYWNGTSWMRLATGGYGQMLAMCDGVPQWGGCLPRITTGTVSGITQANATGGGSISSDGGVAVTARGLCWSTATNPNTTNSKTTDGSGTGSFTSNMSALSTNTTYYARAYATNNVGTAYGNEITFKTATLPSLNTTAISLITQTTAQSGGTISSDGGLPVTTRGVCWSTTINPTTSNNKTINSSGTGSFTSSITGLTASTTYYVRSYAINNAGTAYGNQQSFITSAAPTIPSVTIGTQIWSSKNLAVTTYRNGDPIPQVTDPTQWANLTTGAWCWYNNDSANYEATFGKLYNWHAVNDPRGIAPAGWHVSSVSEWKILTKYLDAGADTLCGNCIPSDIAGGALKSTTGWAIPNNGATNSSGFTAMPGGYRFIDGSFNTGSLTNGTRATWWSQGILNPNISNAIYNNSGYLYITGAESNIGFSVRLIKD